MKQFLLVALMTIAGFVAGYEGRMWQDRHAHIPPPPIPFMSEMGISRPHGGPINRAQLAADIEKVRPQIDAYNRQLMAIDADFDQKLDALLTDDQRKLEDAAKKRHEAERNAHNGPDPSKPLSDDQIARLAVRPFHSLVATIVLPIRFDDLNKTFKFDDAQSAKVLALLKERRERFIALIDSQPPPSFYLSRVAQDVARINDPAKPQ